MMKNRILSLVIISAFISMTGCGKKEQQEPVVQPVQDSEEEITEQEMTEADISGKDALAGVYLNGGKLVSVPMGTYYQEGQMVFCNIKMPSDYVFSAIYTIDGEDETSNEEISGMKLSLAEEKGLKNQQFASKWIHILSAEKDATTLVWEVMTSDDATMENVTEYAKNEVEFGSQEHPAIYYVAHDEYATADLNVCYSINEDILLSISYEGPLADELGLEQLAHNLYDLVEVIE
ncbi:MAG: hypothetical protein IKV59_00285 [Lachnospiraceae bacterium]|nr:hypothetical protein [Lachnospiraceae bacterium]